MPSCPQAGKPFAIKLGKLRGVESQGMLCSARELQLSEDQGGLLELDASAPIGQNVREVLKLDDHVFTLKLTPNLAHTLSVYGVARELSALTGAPLVEPKFEPVQPAHDARLKVKVSAPTCAAASPAASSATSTPGRRRRSGWSIAWPDAASAAA